MSERAQRVAVIGGGANDEHDVAIASAAAITRAVRHLGHVVSDLTIDRSGGWRYTDGDALRPEDAVAVLAAADVVFPTLHGTDGEDGAVAGLLRMIGVPFVGSPVRAGALGMDKWVTKRIAEAIGISTAPGALVRPEDEAASALLHGRPLPVVVKPTTGGSSNGVSVVRSSADLGPALERAFAAGDAALVEDFVVGREVDIALYRDRHGTVRAGATLEIDVAAHDVFDRTQKYDGTASFVVPARLHASETLAVETAARRLYDVLGCAGVARFDFFSTPSGIVLNEVNTAPGFTEQSQVPRMFAAVGLGYDELVAELLGAALDAVLDATHHGVEHTGGPVTP
jgi:D-alanine-D-alanine ligase